MNNSLSFFTQASLYVGDLEPDVTEAELYRLFSEVGRIASIRLMRDTKSKQSMGYAYINYVDPGDAETALETVNYAILLGKPIRIMWCHRDPSMRKRIDSNVFIKNLDPYIDTKTLHDTFSMFGSIYSCKICYDENGISKGYGFVHFDNKADADRAVMTMEGFKIGERKIFVGKFIPRTSMFLNSNKNLNEEERTEIICIGKNFNNLYVKNFSKELTDEDFTNLFKDFGTIISAKVMRKNNGKSKAFGFVCFENGQSSKNAIKELHNKVLEGQTKPLFVAYAEKKTERVQKLMRLFSNEKIMEHKRTNIYVKNLSDDINEEKLRKMFEPFGTIISSILIKRHEKNTGAGLVNYEKHEDAKRAIESLNGTMTNNKPLFVSYAQTKEERRQILDDMFQNARHHQQQQQRFHLQHINALYEKTLSAHSQQTLPQLPSIPNQLQPLQNHPQNFVVNEINHYECSQQQIQQVPQPTFSFPRYLGIIKQNMAIPVNHMDAIKQTHPAILNQKTSNGNASVYRNGNFNVRYLQSPQCGKIFNRVEKLNAKWAPRVTQMFLELETPVLNSIMANESDFNNKASEFIQLLES